MQRGKPPFCALYFLSLPDQTDPSTKTFHGFTSEHKIQGRMVGGVGSIKVNSPHRHVCNARRFVYTPTTDTNVHASLTICRLRAVLFYELDTFRGRAHNPIERTKDSVVFLYFSFYVFCEPPTGVLPTLLGRRQFTATTPRQ